MNEWIDQAGDGASPADMDMEENGAASDDAPLSPVDEARLKAEGWVSPEDVVRHIASIEMIENGLYLDVPKGDDALAKALRQLAGRYGRMFSRNLKQMVELSTTTNDGMVAAAEMFRAGLLASAANPAM